MAMTVTTPTAYARIVTDLQALRESIELTNRINDLATGGANLTEAETADNVRLRAQLFEDLRQSVKRADASTVTLNLHGLNANQWNELVIRCTSVKDGRETKDLAKLAALSVPRMLIEATDANGKHLPSDQTGVANLIRSLSDTQTVELLQTIQELNTPVTSLPKETRTLLESAN